MSNVNCYETIRIMNIMILTLKLFCVGVAGKYVQIK